MALCPEGRNHKLRVILAEVSGHITFNRRMDSMSVTEISPIELRKLLPPLHSQEGVRDPIVYLKFRTTDSTWIWYVTEGSSEGDDFIFFGFVIGLDNEWGQFSLSELAEARGPFGRPVERDQHFKPARFSRVIVRENR
jgi:hypothetical protein